jgi:hypothetical protein
MRRQLQFRSGALWARLVLTLRRIGLAVFGPFVITMAFVLPIYRWLTRTVPGAGVLALILYVSLARWSSVEPYSPAELLEWFSQLDAAQKWAASAALTTILGFMFAFHAASAQAHQQIRLQLVASAVEDFHRHFDEALGCLRTLFIGARQIATQVDSFGGEETPRNVHMARWLNEQTSTVRQAWDRLVDLHIRMIVLGTKHGAVFSNQIGLPRNYDFAIKLMANVVNRPYPLPLPQDPEEFSFADFLAESNVEVLTDFAKVAESAHDRISVVQGMVTTMLRNSIEPLSIIGTFQNISWRDLLGFSRLLSTHYDEMLRAKRNDD